MKNLIVRLLLATGVLSMVLLSFAAYEAWAHFKRSTREGNRSPAFFAVGSRLGPPAKTSPLP
jgi:hypothetical protein